MGDLKTYQSKRDFRRTPEPSGKGKRRSKSKERSFTVQKHDASRLHFDFRLELNGSLVSWAVPKGPSLDPADKRLAVKVEDHPLDYGDFEGTIPKGEYGGGTVMLWDRGTWEPEGSDDPEESLEGGSLKFTLHGEKLKGSWALVRMKGRGEDNWLLIKHKDRWADSGAGDLLETESVKTGRTMEQIAGGEEEGHEEAGSLDEILAEMEGKKSRKKPPSPLDPTLATLYEEAPEGDDWLHEIKFDGYRILATKDGDEVSLHSRTRKDWTDRFSSIADELEFLKCDAILDGEMVVLDPDGVTSFQRLQNALKGRGKFAVHYYVFDLPWLDGQDLRGVPLVERKRLLKRLLDESFLKEDGLIRYSEHIRGNGGKFYQSACQSGLEGIISKKDSSTYRSSRVREWRKTKCLLRQEFVVGGFTEPSGSRSGFGALLLGYYREGEFRYAGKVGTGFSEKALEEMRNNLDSIERSTPPFSDPPSEGEVHWTAPRMVVEVAFREWTDDGHLRQASFQGIRGDKKPKEVERESPLKDEAKPMKKSSNSSKKSSAKEVAGISISHPDRVVFPDVGVTKSQLAEYYLEVGEWILPYVEDRPLSVLRCPEGRQKNCFYQKHLQQGMSDEVGGVTVARKEKDYISVRSIEGLVALVQYGAIEFHPWLSRVDRLERPDLMVFDLDPAEDVPWGEVLGASFLLRDTLRELGLESYPKTTGGKGIHVVVPLVRRTDFDTVKPFSKAVAERVRDGAKGKFVTVASKSRRKGKIFIDYLRNGRGATAVAPYSVRARPGAPVSVPLAWDEIHSGLKAADFTLETVPDRLASIGGDPWEEFSSTRQSITKEMLEELGLA